MYFKIDGAFKLITAGIERNPYRFVSVSRHTNSYTTQGAVMELLQEAIAVADGCEMIDTRYVQYDLPLLPVCPAVMPSTPVHTPQRKRARKAASAPADSGEVCYSQQNPMPADLQLIPPERGRGKGRPQGSRHRKSNERDRGHDGGT